MLFTKHKLIHMLMNSSDCSLDKLMIRLYEKHLLIITLPCFSRSTIQVCVFHKISVRSTSRKHFVRCWDLRQSIFTFLNF